MVFRDENNKIVWNIKTITVSTTSGDIWKCSKCGWEYDTYGSMRFYHTKRRCGAIKEQYGFWRPFEENKKYISSKESVK